MFYFSQFTPIILACLINMRKISMTSPIEKASLYLTFFLFSAFSLALLLMFIYIRKSPAKQLQESYLLSGLRVSDSFVV
jgi:hypothetical protein